MKIAINQLPNNDIVSAANSFYIAAQILKSSKKTSISAPFIVNAALSLELYLKSFDSMLLFTEGMKIKDHVYLYNDVSSKSNNKCHNPKVLYNAIPKDIKEDISNEYLQYNRTFSVDICEFENIFIEWRYPFENKAKTVNINKLLDILETLKIIAIKHINIASGATNEN